MALETLKGLTEIGGYKVISLEEAKEIPDLILPGGGFNWSKYDLFRRDYPIGITHSENIISFKIQNKPIKEAGQNGCQVDTLIETAKIMITELNKKFPCRENSLAITKLEEALHWLDARKKNREQRGVEGKSEA